MTSAAAQLGAHRQFVLEGSVFIAGAVVQWLRDGLKIIRSADEVNQLANSVPNNGGVYLVPAFAGLGAPQWDPYARGTIIGITRDTSAAHIARAALEGVAYQVADLLDAMHAVTGKRFGALKLRVDGGASQSAFLWRILRPDILANTGRAPCRDRNHCLGRGLSRGPGCGVLEKHREHREAMASRKSVRAETAASPSGRVAITVECGIVARERLGTACVRRAQPI